MSLYVIILYDREFVRSADVLDAPDDGSACDTAHHTVQSRKDVDGFELWKSGHRIAAYFAHGRQRPAPMPPPDDQQGGRHRRSYWVPQFS